MKCVPNVRRTNIGPRGLQRWLQHWGDAARRVEPTRGREQGAIIHVQQHLDRSSDINLDPPDGAIVEEILGTSWNRLNRHFMVVQEMPCVGVATRRSVLHMFKQSFERWVMARWVRGVPGRSTCRSPDAMIHSVSIWIHSRLRTDTR